MPQRAAERTGGIGVDEVCRPSWTKSACSVGATRGLPPLGRGFPPRPSRALGVSDWPLCLLSCVWLIVPPSSTQGHERTTGMRSVFQTLHFRGHSTANQMNGVFVSSWSSSQGGRKQDKKNTKYVRKTKGWSGRLNGQVTLNDERETCPCSAAGVNVVLSSRLSPHHFPPSLLALSFPPFLSSFLPSFFLFLFLLSLPSFFLSIWTHGSSLGSLETPLPGWPHADSAEFPDSGIQWEGCPHPRPLMGCCCYCCVQMSSSASIINGAALGFSIILSAWLLTSPTWGLPSPCQAVPSRISGHYRTIPAAKLYHFFIYQFPCSSPIQGNLWEKFSASSPTILQGLKTSLWRTEIRSQKWIYSNKYISILFST